MEISPLRALLPLLNFISFFFHHLLRHLTYILKKEKKRKCKGKDIFIHTHVKDFSIFVVFCCYSLTISLEHIVSKNTSRNKSSSTSKYSLIHTQKPKEKEWKNNSTLQGRMKQEDNANKKGDNSGVFSKTIATYFIEWENHKNSKEKNSLWVTLNVRRNWSKYLAK